MVWSTGPVKKLSDLEVGVLVISANENSIKLEKIPILNRINPRRNTPRHILIKLTKIKHKEDLLKATREKQQITHKGIPIRITGDLSIETLQARREWQDILKVVVIFNILLLL